MPSAPLFLGIFVTLPLWLLVACDDQGGSFGDRVRDYADRRTDRAEGWARSAEERAQTFSERLRHYRERPGEADGERRDRGSLLDRGDRGERTGDLLAHQADYVVEPSGYLTPSFDSAQGTLQIDLVKSCQDWTLQERLTVHLERPSGGRPESSVLYRGTEQLDEQRFSFAYSRRHPDNDADVIGQVKQEGRVLAASFQAPQSQVIDLPRQTVFPVQHLRQLIGAARRGRRELVTIVFDGANLDAYRALARISQPVEANPDDPKVPDIDRLLAQTRSDSLPRGRIYPIHIDYFPVADPAAAPLLQRDMLLHESGVIIGMHIDFGDLRMDATLAHLSRQSPPDCRAGAAQAADR